MSIKPARAGGPSGRSWDSPAGSVTPIVMLGAGERSLGDVQHGSAPPGLCWVPPVILAELGATASVLRVT